MIKKYCCFVISFMFIFTIFIPVYANNTDYLKVFDDAAYLKINSFNKKTYGDTKKTIEKLLKNNVSHLIIDLQDNFGGDLYSSIDTARLFIPKGEIATVILDGKNSLVYISEQEKAPFEILVLVNALTASAAELFAAAIQESGAGKTFGTTTFGKSSIQKVLVHDKGKFEFITVGKYLTRDHIDIAGKGVKLDFDMSTECIEEAFCFLNKIKTISN